MSMAECTHSAALVGLDEGAADDVDRHAIAPSIVHGHGGMLEADDAVADHGQRLAFDLGVAMAHRHRDFLVRTGENLRLDVAAMVDDGFVEAAEARGAIHREIIDIQRLEHVDHEVAAAGGLGHGIALRRQGFHGNLDRARGRRLHGGRERFDRCIDLGVGGRRRQRRGARKGGALEKFAATGIRQRAALRHVFSPKGVRRHPFDRLNSILGPILASQQFPVKAGRTEYRLWPSAEAEMAALDAQAATRYDERKRGAARRPFFISLQDPAAQNSFLSSIEVASSPLAPGTTRM
jgi:hypothetical protein